MRMVTAAGKEQDRPVWGAGPGWEKGAYGQHLKSSLQRSLRTRVHGGPRKPAGVRFKEGIVTGVPACAAVGTESCVGSGGVNNFRGTMTAGPGVEGGGVRGT